MKTKYKILVISIILVVSIFLPSLLFSGHTPEPQTITSNNTGIFLNAQDILEIPGLEIIIGTPEMWEENQKRAEERNAIRLDQLKKLEKDADFVNAGKIIKELNSTNIDDDAYWQTVLDSLIIINEKLGNNVNVTISFEDSETIREIMRQEKLRQEKQHTSQPEVWIIGK